MTLDEYFSSPGAISMAELARRLNKNPDQVRQWRHRHQGRQPSPANCVAIERELGVVTRKDLRPLDYHEHWTDLPREDAPKPSSSRPRKKPPHGASARAR